MPEGEGGSGFTHLVTTGEFKQYCMANDKDHKMIMNALWGADGTDGIVQLVNEIKMYQKIIIGVVLFAEPIIMTLVLRWLGL